MSIELKNDFLNLPQLQLQVDTIVFDYIDSKPNWSKAYEQLNSLLQKCVQNFKDYIVKNDGALPKASTYWVLYMGIVAKLLYFTGLAKSHLIAIEDQEATAQIIKLYKASACCLPNASIEDNEEFLSEVQKSLDQLAGQKNELLTSEKITTCIEKFYAFSKTME